MSKRAKFFEKKGDRERILKCVLAGAVIALFIFAIFGNFIYYKNCDSLECFDDYLVRCSRAKFIDRGNMSFEYKIQGQERDECLVNVRLLRGDLSNQDSLVLQDKSMKCGLPVGVVMRPVDDISLCHGLLKEGLQDLIIKKMHTYIVQNLDRINFDVFD